MTLPITRRPGHTFLDEEVRVGEDRYATVTPLFRCDKHDTPALQPAIRQSVSTVDRVLGPTVITHLACGHIHAALDGEPDAYTLPFPDARSVAGIQVRSIS